MAIAPHDSLITALSQPRWRDFLELTKPKVSLLVVFTAIVGMTPPHFWSLAIARREEYAKVGIPMLPVTHGIPYTRRQILRYTVLRVLCTLIPVAIGMSGWIYLGAALALDARFLYLAVALERGVRPDLPIRIFRFSITYLMALFGAFIADHYCRLLL
jgi:heme o synthase